jgi:uncharacterized protein (TIGR02284 family)
MTDDRIISTLNGLIQAAKDGEQGFALAAKDARDPDLARVFGDAETTSRAAVAELQDQVRLLGGTAEQEGSLKAAAHRSWRSVRSMLSARDDMSILEERERDEGFVRARYTEALELDLPEPIRSVVSRHREAAVDCHYRVLDLRNRFRDNNARALRHGSQS